MELKDYIKMKEKVKQYEKLKIEKEHYSEILWSLKKMNLDKIVVKGEMETTDSLGECEADIEVSLASVSENFHNEILQLIIERIVEKRDRVVSNMTNIE